MYLLEHRVQPKDRVFLKGILFKHNPAYFWIGKFSGNPVTALYLKSSMPCGSITYVWSRPFRPFANYSNLQFKWQLTLRDHRFRQAWPCEPDLESRRRWRQSGWWTSSRPAGVVCSGGWRCRERPRPQRSCHRGKPDNINFVIKIAVFLNLKNYHRFYLNSKMKCYVCHRGKPTITFNS